MKILKWILIIVGGGFALYIVGAIVALIVLFAQFDSSSYEELVANYEEKSKEIREVEQFINSRLPKNKVVEIEFENYSISRFYVRTDGKYDPSLDISGTKSVKEEDLLKDLNWSYKTTDSLKRKLDKAGCISVQSGTPCQIGFQRHGMGMYFYNLFDEPVPDSLTNNYNDSCRYILYKKDVALEWLGGAIGVQCFPEFNRKRR
ncbi:hypothetical protein V9L05_15855 [Bernardetia sp. Wsw4-3y2]|uniref:hypothetical protein n=1 Tax=Bernardetia sp. Wsw4-3y2 TaxID=3127471 RepID=UPI0030CB8BC3